MNKSKSDSPRPDGFKSVIGRQALRMFFLVFLLLASGIVVVGVFSYRHYDRNFRNEVEHNLSAIAELKVDELVLWRKERLGDANAFLQNRAFSILVKRFFDNPSDADAKGLLLDWVGKYFQHFDYDQFSLMDARGVTRLSLGIGGTDPESYSTSQTVSNVIRTGRVAFQDFYLSGHDQRPHLSIMIPVMDDADKNLTLGLLVLRIDPEKYLYPMIKKWPSDSETAETLLIRRDGTDALFLNELRFQTNTAINLRVPLDRVSMPAVQAALGREGIILDGIDYRGQPVFAVVRAIPDSPWKLVARVDTAEVYAPLRNKLWQIVGTVSLMLLLAGSVTGMIWRQQRLRFYKKEAELADSLRQSRELLLQFVHNSPIYAFIKKVTPTESRVLMASENYREMIGIGGSIMEGKSMEEIFPAGLAEKITRDDWSVVAGGKMLSIEEELNGRNYATIKFPLRSGDGSYLAGYTMDITERKRTEEEIMQSRSAALNIMEDAIAERDRSEKAVAEQQRAKDELQKSNEDLQAALQDLKKAQKMISQQERLSALGRLVSGIAHDFNNALIPIVGYSDLLVSDPEALDDKEEARRMIGVIRSAGKDASHIVSRLREVYKKEEEAAYANVDIASVIEKAIAMTMPKWKEEMRSRNVAVAVEKDFQPVPGINGNASELREAFTNLILNSVDAMPQGGTLTFRVSLVDDWFVAVDVTDTGQGMDEQTLRNCLDPFYTTKGVHGSGLGLAMVHGIVQRHKGKIEVDSRVGAGTKIRILLPVAVGAKRNATEEGEQTGNIHELKVLLVDDDERSLKLVSTMLRADGHDPETVHDPRKGIDIFRTGNYDLVITDRAMPSMGGDEVAREIQRIRPGTPVIMLTGFGAIMNDSGDCPEGVSRVISKPVTRNDLRAAIASVLNLSNPADSSGHADVE